MPPVPAQQQPQGQPSKYLIFSDFSLGMNTQATREGLDKRAAAWMENLQPIAPNSLQGVLSPVPSLATLTGETVAKTFYAVINGQDYLVYFCASGAAYTVTINGGVSQTATGGVIVKFAPAGTFSAAGGDLTTFNNDRLLITDSKSSYVTYDGTIFVQPGGVSPNFAVTNGGSGYSGGATAAISGGTGTGATASVQTSGGVVTGLTLTNAGTGYLAGDTLTVTITGISGGSGATAKAHPWPTLSTPPITLAVAFGRVWLAVNRTLICTGTGSSTYGQAYDDFLTGDASVTTTVSDVDLIHQITVLRFLEGFLYIIGDNSVKSIGSITVNGGVTSFTITPLSSDQGTTFQQSVVSFNRLVLFANTTGVFAVFGASVEKISDAMDGIFQSVNFTQPLVAAINDVNNIHTFLLLVRYNDPTQGLRSLILSYFNKRWFVMSQGSGLITIVSAVLNGHYDTFGSSGSDVTQLIQGSAALPYKLQTALDPADNPIIDKRMVRIGIAQVANGQSDMMVTADTDRSAVNISLQNEFPAPVIWLNNQGQIVTWVNNSGGEVDFFGQGFILSHSANFSSTGRFIGATSTGTLNGIRIVGIYIEHQDGALWGRGTIGG